MTGATALVAGATGIVGRNLIEHLNEVGGWDVVGIARRPESDELAAEMIAVDLGVRDAVLERLDGVSGVTHVFYAARAPRADAGEEARVNTAMLVNLLDAVEPASPELRHVHLMHGNKWYGSHIGPFRTPAKEDDPRIDGPNFYYDQQDHVAARQRGKRWTWSALRPHFVSGFSVGHPHNIIGVIATYGALCRELGLPLAFPASRARFDTLTQLTDARLLAKAMVWAATDRRCRNQAFNIGNGDNIRWSNSWPRVAALFGLEPAPPGTVRIADFLADKGPAWDEMVRRHGLKRTRLDEVASPAYAAFALGIGWDEVTSLVKARRYGFCEAVDSEEMIARAIAEYRRRRVIPA
jgi:nucleoside-diphosphate-sugar epimerase